MTVHFPVRWQTDLEQREYEIVDDLEIRPMPRGPSRARIEALMSRVEDWQGAANTRSLLLLDEPTLNTQGMARAHQIQAELIAGKPLVEIAAYAEWLGPRR